ncbi:MAG: hypothetical protein QM790_06305 [Nibricoccus sp.]
MLAAFVVTLKSCKLPLALGTLAASLLVFDAYHRVPETSASPEAERRRVVRIIEPRAAIDPLGMASSQDPPTTKLKPSAEEDVQRDPKHELAQQLQAIDADYKSMSENVLVDSQPIIQPADRAKLELLDKEKLADIGKVLSAEELDVYENTADPASAPRRR